MVKKIFVFDEWLEVDILKSDKLAVIAQKISDAYKIKTGREVFIYADDSGNIKMSLSPLHIESVKINFVR